MTKVVVRLPEPKEEYEVSNQKQINMKPKKILDHEW